MKYIIAIFNAVSFDFTRMMMCDEKSSYNLIKFFYTSITFNSNS